MRLAAPRSKARLPLRAVLYHHIASKVSSLVDRLAVSTAPNLFEAHVRKLARDYEIVSLDSVLSGRLPRRALLLTFDDGYRSFVTSALPVLRRLGLPSVLFVTGACLDPYSVPLDNLLSYLCASVGLERLTAALDPRVRNARSCLQLLDLVAAMPYGRFVQLGDELADRFEVDQAALRAESGIFLNPEDLAGLSAAGCEVANHTRSHPFCRSIPDEEVAREEIVDHARRLESLTGRPVRAFSYPHGRREDATPMVERILRESGHSASFLAESRPHLNGSTGRVWNRVRVDGYATWRIAPELAPMPTLRGRPNWNLARASEALADLARTLAPVDTEVFTPLEDALSDWRTPRRVDDLGSRFPALLQAAQEPLGGDIERYAFNRALIAPALARLHAFLSERRDGYELGDDYFLRDVRLAAGWTVPCGSEVIDLRARFSLPGSIQIALKAKAPHVALRHLRPTGPDAWFAPHLELRYLDEFDETGWETTFRNVASLLRRHTDVVGVVGYSWFYDPKLETISPQLAYLRRRPTDGGAFFLRGHTSEFDIKNATAKSQTRRRLYEAGQYTPVGYKMVWLRRDILSWADRTHRAGYPLSMQSG
jgi:peptidoglycan/xylan/chitin deacetylase (PgdA/CDA1 family)